MDCTGTRDNIKKFISNIVKEFEAERLLEIIQSMEQGKEARIIGKFVKEPDDTIFIENYFGGKRILAQLDGNMLPRIC